MPLLLNMMQHGTTFTEGHANGNSWQQHQSSVHHWLVKQRAVLLACMTSLAKHDLTCVLYAHGLTSITLLNKPWWRSRKRCRCCWWVSTKPVSRIGKKVARMAQSARRRLPCPYDLFFAACCGDLTLEIDGRVHLLSFQGTLGYQVEIQNGIKITNHTFKIVNI